MAALHAIDMPAMARFEQVQKEWRDAGLGVGEFVITRDRIEAKQARERRIWKKRKRAPDTPAARSSTTERAESESHGMVEELD